MYTGALWCGQYKPNDESGTAEVLGYHQGREQTRLHNRIHPELPTAAVDQSGNAARGKVQARANEAGLGCPSAVRSVLT
jgi:hypothetical protein